VVTASTSVSGDDELLEWLVPRSKGDVLIAIDAPLVVRNKTGRRPCDTLISRCFGRHHASTHSANLGLPAFRNGVRGELLTQRLDIGIDPEFEPRQPVRRAIEVYPHPAIVALFGLTHTRNLGFYYNAEGIGYSDDTIQLGTYDASLDRLGQLEGEVTIDAID
jgi:predicted RNase H-like nuclease